MSVETDIIEKLSISKKTCIENICQRIADLYKEAKNVNLETSETDITYFIAQTIQEYDNQVLLLIRDVIANLNIITMDRPAMIHECQRKGITINDGSYTKINISVEISIPDGGRPVTLYNYADPNNPNITPVIFTDGQHNWVIDNPNDVLNNNATDYDVTFTQSGTHNIACRCVSKGDFYPTAGEVNQLVGTINGVVSSSISNAQYSFIKDGEVIATDSNGVYKRGTDIEDDESIRNKLLMYNTQSEINGSEEHLQRELYNAGCDIARIYKNCDYVAEHNGVPPQKTVISVSGGNVDDIFNVIKNNMLGSNYNFQAIQNKSISRVIEEENGYCPITINMVDNVVVGITLHTTDTIPAVIQQTIITSLYNDLIEDKFYKQDNLCRIQSVRTFLENILYENEYNYNFDSIYFTNYPAETELQGDIYTIYKYSESAIIIRQ